MTVHANNLVETRMKNVITRTTILFIVTMVFITIVPLQGLFADTEEVGDTARSIYKERVLSVCMQSPNDVEKLKNLFKKTEAPSILLLRKLIANAYSSAMSGFDGWTIEEYIAFVKSLAIIRKNTGHFELWTERELLEKILDGAESELKSIGAIFIAAEQAGFDPMILNPLLKPTKSFTAIEPIVSELLLELRSATPALAYDVFAVGATNITFLRNATQWLRAAKKKTDSIDQTIATFFPAASGVKDNPGLILFGVALMEQENWSLEDATVLLQSLPAAFPGDNGRDMSALAREVAALEHTLKENALFPETEAKIAVRVILSTIGSWSLSRSEKMTAYVGTLAKHGVGPSMIFAAIKKNGDFILAEGSSVSILDQLAELKVSPYFLAQFPLQYWSKSNDASSIPEMFKSITEKGFSVDQAAKIVGTKKPVSREYLKKQLRNVLEAWESVPNPDDKDREEFIFILSFLNDRGNRKDMVFCDMLTHLGRSFTAREKIETAKNLALAVPRFLEQGAEQMVAETVQLVAKRNKIPIPTVSAISASFLGARGGDPRKLLGVLNAAAELRALGVKDTDLIALFDGLLIDRLESTALVCAEFPHFVETMITSGFSSSDSLSALLKILIDSPDSADTKLRFVAAAIPAFMKLTGSVPGTDDSISLLGDILCKLDFSKSQDPLTDLKKILAELPFDTMGSLEFLRGYLKAISRNVHSLSEALDAAKNSDTVDQKSLISMILKAIDARSSGFKYSQGMILELPSLANEIRKEGYSTEATKEIIAAIFDRIEGSAGDGWIYQKEMILDTLRKAKYGSEVRYLNYACSIIRYAKSDMLRLVESSGYHVQKIIEYGLPATDAELILVEVVKRCPADFSWMLGSIYEPRFVDRKNITKAEQIAILLKSLEYLQPYSTGYERLTFLMPGLEDHGFSVDQIRQFVQYMQEIPRNSFSFDERTFGKLTQLGISPSAYLSYLGAARIESPSGKTFRFYPSTDFIESLVLHYGLTSEKILEVIALFGKEFSFLEPTSKSVVNIPSVVDMAWYAGAETYESLVHFVETYTDSLSQMKENEEASNIITFNRLKESYATGEFSLSEIARLIGSGFLTSNSFIPTQKALNLAVDELIGAFQNRKPDLRTLYETRDEKRISTKDRLRLAALPSWQPELATYLPAFSIKKTLDTFLVSKNLTADEIVESILKSSGAAIMEAEIRAAHANLRSDLSLGTRIPIAALTYYLGLLKTGSDFRGAAEEVLFAIAENAYPLDYGELNLTDRFLISIQILNRALVKVNKTQDTMTKIAEILLAAPRYGKEKEVLRFAAELNVQTLRAKGSKTAK